MAWALGHHRQPDLWKIIIEIYKALFLKPVSSTADLETKNYTCVTGLVDLKRTCKDRGIEEIPMQALDCSPSFRHG
jgi:hypothetical protein